MNSKIHPKNLRKDGLVVVTRVAGLFAYWIMRDAPRGGWGQECS